MKYLILLFLIASCSSTKQETRTDMRKNYNPTQKYFQRKLINKKTQVAMTNI